MSKLAQHLSALRRLFEPWHSAPNGTVIWGPEETDPNGQFKRDLIAKATVVLIAGDRALVGSDFDLPTFGELELDSIGQVLVNDHEQRDFYELALACIRVVGALDSATSADR